MKGNLSRRSSILSPKEIRKLENQIGYLDNLGFKSHELVEMERGRFNYFLEKPKAETIHVTDLWSIREQKNFLKMQGLADAEKERIKRASMEVGGPSVKDRRQQDKFRDTKTFEKLPKLTLETEKLRNKPTNRRVLETYSLYSKSHTQLERPSFGSPKHYQLNLKKQKSRFYSPQADSKLKDFDGLIDACNTKIKTNENIRNDILLSPIVSPFKCARNEFVQQKKAERIAKKVKRLLDSEFHKI
mmetsp:Transcript_11979/g.22921  ORF Transcript_11979/g.22921 Transcript_11979/m.22921 type:complete len:244 (+) Transcript_11979:355-1086(+)|eukprot:CAMPEP_0204918374 /NCGR_PEP_ID=MMETSP1397-20131031/16115_1 /ASSEMBLY_ACC=CAM_ASM_000891 /TAXON_ID=49980 /ORGANISM="Climacostomum Climacostomum virens, Strain Stock W-24" /LENGTH=243 /DNA_ID=CAMNT_0052091651 /DNA_START=6 /DNA_END=737 /DNA_ORIENTATION=-